MPEGVEERAAADGEELREDAIGADGGVGLEGADLRQSRGPLRSARREGRDAVATRAGGEAVGEHAG